MKSESGRRKRTILPKGKARLLEREQWSFENIPENERLGCLYFEYARESGVLLNDLTIWKRIYPNPTKFPNFFDLPKAGANQLDLEALRRLYSSPARIALVCDKFPSIPWCKVDNDQRRKRMKIIRWDDAERAVRYSKKLRDHAPLAKVAVAAFNIPSWELTDVELLREFSTWLKIHRSFPSDRSKRGRIAVPSDLLFQLGVLRRVRHAKKHGGSVSVEQICEDIDARNIIRSKKKAEHFLKTFYP